MNYLIVKISADVAWVDAWSHEPRYLSMDGCPLAPGTYASAVTELPASQTMEGRPLAQGFYAIFWPMEEHSPSYDESPLYFGPFPSRRKADAHVHEVSSKVLPDFFAEDSARLPSAEAGERRSPQGTPCQGP